MEFNKKNFTFILGICFSSILFLILLINLGDILGWLGGLMGILTPFITGLCLAFLLNLLMRGLENHPFRFMRRSSRSFVRKASRPLCLVLSLVIAAGILVLVVVIIAPEVAESMRNVATQLPGYANQLYNWLYDLAEHLNLSTETLGLLEMDWQSLFDKLADFLMKSSNSFFSTATQVTSSIVNVFMNATMGMVIAIYVLLQKEHLQNITTRIVMAFLPRKVTDWLFKVSKLSFSAFSNFFSGQLLESTILGSLCFIGMLILRMPYAAAVSVLIGITSLVPVIGPITGAALATALIFLSDPMQALFFLIFIVILQQIEGNVIYPKVVGKSVGLPGLLVILAVILGSSLGGIMGILVGIPACSVLYTLFRGAVRHQLKKKGLEKLAAEPEEE